MDDLWQFAVLGLTAGGAYALTSLGVVAVYRGSGVLNFAHGAIGMVGTYAFWEVYEDGEGWPLWLAIAFGLLVGGLIGFIVYAVVMRALRKSVEVARLIATLGVLLILQGAALVEYDVQPERVGQFIASGSFDIFGAPMRQTSAYVVLMTIVLAAALTLLFRKTRLGLAATAIQERPVAASTLGISPDPTGITVWVLGGVLAAAAGIFLLPTTGLSPLTLTALIFPALACGLLARFRNFWIAILAGFAIGIAESVLLSRGWPTGIIKSVPFAVIVVALVVGGTAIPGRGVDMTRLPALGSGQLRWRSILLWTGASVFVVLVLGGAWNLAIISSAIAALIGLSIVLVTGYAGQISLAPFGIAGLASLLTAHAAGTWDLPFLVTILIGVGAAAVAGIVIGLPAIRVRGVDLAVATLGFALVIEHAVLNDPDFVGGTLGIAIPDASVLGLDLDPATAPEHFAILCIAAVLLAGIGVANIRRGRSGRRYAAIRANERGAAALGISIAEAKVAAFAVSGALAGLAGALVTYRTNVATFDQFDVFRSITALGFTIVGGVGFVAGGIFAGALAAGGVVTHLVEDVIFGSADWLDDWLPILSGVFVVEVMLVSPDGLIPMLTHLRGQLGSLAKRAVHRFRPAPVDAAVAAAPNGNGAEAPARRVAEPGEVLLRAQGIGARYGAVTALDGVDFEVRAGQVLGVIGPNGAGKTTLIDVITGFTRASAGSVTLRDRDITRARVLRRARSGLARTFQNLELFDDLSVRENLLAGADRRDLAAYVTDLVVPGRRELDHDLTEVARTFSLLDVLDERIEDLPQGTRRLVSIARAVATRPAVVCLDEPTAGLNATECNNVADTVRMLVDRYGMGVLLVEHNVDLVARLCERILVLDFGRVIAYGSADEVFSADVVREAYLGTGRSAWSSTAQPEGATR